MQYLRELLTNKRTNKKNKKRTFLLLYFYLFIFSYSFVCDYDDFLFLTITVGFFSLSWVIMISIMVRLCLIRKLARLLFSRVLVVSVTGGQGRDVSWSLVSCGLLRYLIYSKHRSLHGHQGKHQVLVGMVFTKEKSSTFNNAWCLST